MLFNWTWFSRFYEGCSNPYSSIFPKSETTIWNWLYLDPTMNVKGRCFDFGWFWRFYEGCSISEILQFSQKSETTIWNWMYLNPTMNVNPNRGVLNIITLPPLKVLTRRWVGGFYVELGSLLAHFCPPLGPFGSLLAPFGSVLPHFWHPLAHFWCPWLTFAHPGGRFSQFWGLLASFFIFVGIFDDNLM